MTDFVLRDRRDDIAVLTLNRPERLNAWHASMRAELLSALDEIDGDGSCAAVVLTGSGSRAFSAGQDLAETEQFDESDVQRWMDEWHDLYGRIRWLQKPIVAALNGVAAGSAFQVALLCDIRVGHTDSRMGQPEILSGIPSILGPWIMLDMLGRSRTIELVLTGRMMDGAEAHGLGLIHHLVDADMVMPKALAVATELAAKPRVAMRLNRHRFAEVNEETFQDALAAARRISAQAFASGEPQAAMRKFFEKRRQARGET